MDIKIITVGGARRGLPGVRPVKFEHWKCGDKYFITDFYPEEVRVYATDCTGYPDDFNSPTVLFTAKDIEAAKNKVIEIAGQK